MRGIERRRGTGRRIARIEQEGIVNKRKRRRRRRRWWFLREGKINKDRVVVER